MSTSVVGYRHPAIEAVEAIDAGLTALADASLWSLSAAELAQLVVTVERISRRVNAAQLPLLAQADSSQVAALTGATSIGAWLRDVADVPMAVSRARLALHQSLQRRPTTAAAFNAGEISIDSAGAGMRGARCTASCCAGDAVRRDRAVVGGDSP